MRWNTRIAILAGFACVIAAVFYFRVFQPGPPNAVIHIDPEEQPADPFEFVLANRSKPEQKKLANLGETEARISEPSKPIAASSAPKPKQKKADPIPVKKVDVPPKDPAPIKPVAVKVLAKREVAKPKQRIYTVKSGDSLWRIARDQLGDASRHPELAKLNDIALDGDSNNLKLGQKIILPLK